MSFSGRSWSPYLRPLRYRQFFGREIGASRPGCGSPYQSLCRPLLPGWALPIGCFEASSPYPCRLCESYIRTDESNYLPVTDPYHLDVSILPGLNYLSILQLAGFFLNDLKLLFDIATRLQYCGLLATFRL